MTTATRAYVDVRSLSKSYGAVPVLEDVSFELRKGEFITLLGPSGSGKTTVLMAMAGFVQPNSGTLLIDGCDILRAPPHERNIGVVFQNYALFPNMSVAENIGYPLKIRKVPTAERARRVAASLDLIGLASMGSRRIDQLSGGQRQRIALARALVFEPALVLMDEPLSALDRKLREHMQVEIRRILTHLGTTAICVTHDQTEALTMSDRVAVMNRGRIAQIDTPRRIYEHPTSRFVADFIGQTSFLEGKVNGTVIEVRGQSLRVGRSLRCKNGGAALVALRPEKLVVLETRSPEFNQLQGRVMQAVYRGDCIHLAVRLESGEEVISHQSIGAGTRTEFKPGDTILLGVHPDDTIVVPE